jgi:hypothetical protein
LSFCATKKAEKDATTSRMKTARANRVTAPTDVPQGSLED